jgi:hypothetical protein
VSFRIGWRPEQRHGTRDQGQLQISFQ